MTGATGGALRLPGMDTTPGPVRPTGERTAPSPTPLDDTVAEMVIRIRGTDPITQGSKSGFVPPHPIIPGKQAGHCRGGRAVIAEDRGPKHKHWRKVVTDAALAGMSYHLSTKGIAWPKGYDGPVAVRMVFMLHRPSSAKKTERWAWKRPDIDKLARAVLDALDDADVYRDDGRVVRLAVDKLYTSPDPGPDAEPGVTVHVALMV